MVEADLRGEVVAKGVNNHLTTSLLCREWAQLNVHQLSQQLRVEQSIAVSYGGNSNTQTSVGGESIGQGQHCTRMRETKLIHSYTNV